MSSAHHEDAVWKLEGKAIGAGAASGFVAGVVTGLLLQLGTDMIPVFGAFLGATTIPRGWIVHQGISTLYGVIFAAVLAYPPIQSFTASFRTYEFTAAGVTYGVMISAATITLLPFVFELPWATPASQAPYPAIPGLELGGFVPAASFGIAYLAFGAVLGAVYHRIGITGD